jgi:hypothetical protein
MTTSLGLLATYAFRDLAQAAIFAEGRRRPIVCSMASPSGNHCVVIARKCKRALC